jgi:hypothetical protein
MSANIRALMTSAFAQGRQAIEQMMTSTADVYRKGTITDDAGGQVDTYTVVGTYPCLFEAYPIRPIENESEPMVRAIVTWQFIFPLDVSIRETDRIHVGSRVFEVISQRVGTMSISNHVICLEIL